MTWFVGESDNAVGFFLLPLQDRGSAECELGNTPTKVSVLSAVRLGGPPSQAEELPLVLSSGKAGRVSSPEVVRLGERLGAEPGGFSWGALFDRLAHLPSYEVWTGLCSVRYWATPKVCCWASAELCSL